MESHLLSLNEFNKPRVLDDGDAGYMHIIHLLLCTQGRYPSHPTMGVGIRERYRFNNDENFLMNLKKDIEAQINQFLPELRLTDVRLNIRDNVLGIIIDTAEGAYAIAYNSDEETMNAAATYVLGNL